MTTALASLATLVFVNEYSCIQPASITLVNRISCFPHQDAQQSKLVVTSQHVNKDIADNTTYVEKLMAKQPLNAH